MNVVNVYVSFFLFQVSPKESPYLRVVDMILGKDEVSRKRVEAER